MQFPNREGLTALCVTKTKQTPVQELGTEAEKKKNVLVKGDQSRRRRTRLSASTHQILKVPEKWGTYLNGLPGQVFTLLRKRLPMRQQEDDFALK